MSTIKADNISPVGSTLNLTAPVAGLSVAGGLTVGGIAYFSGGATFASTTDHGGVARFAAGVTMSSSLDVNGTLKVGDFGGATNVMVKPTNAAGTVGQVVPLLTWGGNIGSATHERNHTTPLPPGTWFVVLNGNCDSASQSENPVLSMAQTWVVPSGKYLVFAHTSLYTATASASNSGLAWKLINANDVGSYRGLNNIFPYTEITGANGWTYISSTNETAQLINAQNADTATGGDRQASGCVYQGTGVILVASQVTGYAIRIA